MKKMVSFLLLLLAVIVFATWQYRLLCLLLFVRLNRQWMIQKYGRHCYRITVLLLIVCIFIAIPNYFQRGRTQLVYLDSDGERISTPLPVYLANSVLPEEELMNAGMKATAILPPASLSPVFKNLGSRFVRDAQRDFWSGMAWTFYAPYNRLSLQGSNPGSFAYAQAMNEIAGTNFDGVYITKPRHDDKTVKYPVVFFAHGYLGSWELYQGLFSRLNDCFVVSIGTRDLSGIFSYQDINKVFTKYLPMLKDEGYNIEESRLHLIGLSNGGTASNVALRSFSDKFQTITFISTSCDVIKRSKAKVILFGGGKDASAVGLPSAARHLQRCGTMTALMFDENENHYMMVHQADEMLDFLNKEMGLLNEK